MTSKVSNKKVSPVLHNFMCGVKSRIKMAIIIGILHLAAAPAVIISLIAGIYSRNPSEMVTAFAVIGVITTSIAGFVGIFIAIDSFSCLHNKSVVDMRLSLPLTATQRFLSNFLSGFAVYIVPFLAAQIVSLLGLAYGFIFMEGRTFEDFAGYNEFGEIQYREYTCEFFSIGMTMLLKLILAGILTMLMLYTITVLVTVCCGNKFESIAYTILINIMIPLTIYLVFMSMFSELFGVYISDNILMIIMYTSPAGGILAAVNWVTGEIGRVSMNYAVWAIVYFLITAGIGAGAFFLYRKRRAEQVSKPFVFKLIYHIISTAAIFCIYSVFYYNQTGIVPAIVTTAIVYLILEFAAKRGFKKMWVSLIKYVGVMGASVLIIFVAQKTEGFGMVTRVPDISQVKYVEMDYGGFYDMFSQPYYGGEKIKLKFTEKENIETIISAHQTAVNNRHKGLAAVGTDIEIRYHLKSGGTMVRIYNVMTAEETEIMSRIDLTDEYKTQIADIYKKELLNAENAFKSYAAYNTTYAYSLKTQFNSVCGVSLLNETQRGISAATLVERGFYERLAEAYEKDIMNINEENYYKSDLKNIYRLFPTLTNFHNITIPESFSNTLAVVEQFGFTVEKMEELPDKEVSEYLENASKGGNLLIFTADEWRKMNTVPDDVSLHSSYSLSRGMDNRINVENIDKDICDLFRAAEPMNIVPDNGYIIYVFGRTGVIPEELKAVAERVYAGISAKGSIEYDEYGNPFWLESTDEVIIPQEVPAGTTAYYVYD